MSTKIRLKDKRLIIKWSQEEKMSLKALSARSDVEIVPIEPDCLAILSGQVEESLKDGTQDEPVDRTKDESVNITKPIRVEQTKETLRQKGIMAFFPKKNN